MNGQFALNVGVSNSGKEYAIKKPQITPKAQEEAVAVSQGARESGVEWIEDKNSDLSLSNRIDESDLLLTTSTTAASIKVASSAKPSQGFIQELKDKFKKLLVSAYGNMFSHNRLLAKVSEWMAGTATAQLALMGISTQELEDIKSGVRLELIDNNHVAMEQVVYDETMLEILT